MLFYYFSRWLSLGKFFERVYELVDELQAFLPQEYNDLADCLAENAFLLKVAYICDIFFKLNKINISMQGWHKIYLTFQIKCSVH